MSALKNHEGVVGGVRLQWYWETNWKCWVVTAHDDEGNQIGESQTCSSRRTLEWTKEQVAREARR